MTKDELSNLTGFKFDEVTMKFKEGHNLRKVQQLQSWPEDKKGNKVIGGRLVDGKIVRKKINPIRYPGGKFMMLKHILPLIPEHLVYVEPFIGGGTVYWNKPLVKNNIVNDLSGNVVNFYRQLKTNKDELVFQLKSLLHSRQLYNECKKWLKTKQDNILD